MARLIFSLLICLGLMLPGVRAHAADYPVTLRMMAATNDNHPLYKAITLPWNEAVASASGGAVTVKYFNPGTLCAEAEIYDSVLSGLLDIGSNNTSRNPGKFAYSYAFGLPFLSPSAYSSTMAAVALLGACPRFAEEYSAAHLLWFNATSPLQLLSVKAPIKTLEDLKGMKVISFGVASADLIRALGGTPISVTPSESYMSLERGMAQAVIAPVAFARSNKLTEVAKYLTIVNASSGLGYSLMNKDSLAKLSPEGAKAVLHASVADLSANSGRETDAAEKAEIARLTESGIQVYVLPEAERARWVEKSAPIVEAWVAGMEGKGNGDARAFIEQMRALIRANTPSQASAL